jgi:hypothetical protein
MKSLFASQGAQETEQTSEVSPSIEPGWECN